MSCPHGNPIGGCDTCDEVDAAFEAGKRSALAEQPAQQEQEPICKLFGTLPVYDRAVQQEPVAIALNTGTKQGVKWLKNVEHGESLYTTPQPAQQEPMAWPAGLIERITAAEQRIQDGHAPRRIPADPTDVDLVLAEVRYLLEGKQPPFWVSTSPPAQRTWVGLTDEEIYSVLENLQVMHHRPPTTDSRIVFARAIEAAHGIKENT